MNPEAAKSLIAKAVAISEVAQAKGLARWKNRNTIQQAVGDWLAESIAALQFISEMVPSYDVIYVDEDGDEAGFHTSDRESALAALDHYESEGKVANILFSYSTPKVPMEITEWR